MVSIMWAFVEAARRSDGNAATAPAPAAHTPSATQRAVPAGSMKTTNDAVSPAATHVPRDRPRLPPMGM